MVREVILFWVPSRLSLRRAALAALLATAAASAAANVLVVRSSGPSAKSYPPGRSLPDNARITLQANDTLVVIVGGSTRTFRGPGTFSPSAPVEATTTRTVTASSGRRARIGAVRTAGIVPAAPTIWHVDVSQSGNVCVADPTNVNLWRPDATEPTSLTIAAANGSAQQVNWPAGQATLAWPAAMPVADGAEYRIRQPGVAVPTRITFRTVTTIPTDAEAVAQALIERECQEQLDVLIETTPEDAPAS